ncbi:MAG: alanine--tRNA ligase [Actinomycetota bacterium]
MDGRQVRERFLAFFEERGHKRVPSSSLIPPPETGLLLTNAGMNQFIPYFLGQAQAPWPRATSVQKCFRTGDLDNVGHTARHLTLFEMLGNFSFADYFKAESLTWGLELITEGYGIDIDRLWATYYADDAETAAIWVDLGFPAERIVARGKADNYWSTHAAGPAGPTGEIFVDRGAAYGPDGGPAVDEERFMEIWNHVFMQDLVDDRENKIGDLPGKNVDTGASVERLAMVTQGADSFYDTDIMAPLIDIVQSLSGKTYGGDERADVSMRIVAEHGRATTFLIADGVLPSNEGRGYVLRRMLRRMVSHARRLGIEQDFTGRLVDASVDMLGDAYPELHENHAFTLQVAASEEERFAGTLRQGMALFEGSLVDAKGSGTLAGDTAFTLHDTHGFPLELTVELAADAGLEVDRDRFTELMQEQRGRAQKAAKKGLVSEEVLAEILTRAEPTRFVGYETLEADANVIGLLGGGDGVAQEGNEVRVVLDTSPFYAEGGGQVGDQGLVRTATGVIRITDTQRAPGDVFVHAGVVESGEVREGEDARAEVDPGFRESTARSHTATHIVHWTLRHFLGEHARQAGSLVAPGRLRFDFMHPSSVPQDVLEEAEMRANERLSDDDAIRTYETTMEFAKSQGATALFGEKYGDLVRVVEIGDYSRELCGGTHVPHTGNVAVVRILGEGSIGSGIRRIEAVVGPDAIRQVNVERHLLQRVAAALGGGDPESVPERILKVVEENKRLKNELGRMSKGEIAGKVEQIIGRHSLVAGVALVNSLEDADADELRELAQATVNRLERPDAPAATVLGNGNGGKALLVAACSPSLVDRGVTAPALLEEAAKMVGGGAGGKPGLAFAGGKKADAVKDAVRSIPSRLEALLAAGA